MPKTATPRRRYGSTSLYTNDATYDPATSKTKYVPNENLRNVVGDQGAEKVKEARKTLNTGDDIVSSSDEQETPTQRRDKNKAKAAQFKTMTDKAMDDAISMVKAKKSSRRADYD